MLFIVPLKSYPVFTSSKVLPIIPDNSELIESITNYTCWLVFSVTSLAITIVTFKLCDIRRVFISTSVLTDYSVNVQNVRLGILLQLCHAQMNVHLMPDHGKHVR